jgi:hypothetical protein
MSKFIYIHKRKKIIFVKFIKKLMNNLITCYGFFKNYQGY